METFFFCAESKIICQLLQLCMCGEGAVHTHTHTYLLPPRTFQEGFHGSTVGHVDWPSPRVGGEGGVGAAGQQETHHLHVVVLHGIMQRSKTENRINPLWMKVRVG